MKKLLSSALFLSAGAFAAGFPNINSVHGNYVEARTADVYTGPCFANSEVGLTGDLAVFGWKVAKGSWDGVQLDGLSVVGVVRAKSTLGDVYTESNPAKSVLIVDTKADAEQRLALQAFAKHMGGLLLSDVVRVEYTPVTLDFANNDLHSMAATLKAGDLAKIETRALNEGDQICHNEAVWYSPLTSLNHAMPAYALANDFKGKGLGTTWSSPFKRSAFVGSFSATE
ncbi:MAG: DUF1326 domain-containing protein [Acidobacteriota bacterium]|nr:DUF1326 domain-containing protein [Acidobacteriota bacterium]